MVAGITKTLIGLIAALIVVSAILVAIARELVEEIDHFKPQFQNQFQRRTGLNLQFDQIQGSWKGLAPKFQLQNVLLNSSPDSQAGISAEDLSLEISLVETVLNLQPRFRLQLQGAQVNFDYVDGKFELQGVQFPNTDKRNKNNDALLDFLLAQREISIVNSHVLLQGYYPQVATLDISKLKIESNGDLSYILGSLKANGPSALSLRLRGNLSGSFSNKRSLAGNIYAKVAQGELLPWIPLQNRDLSQGHLTALEGEASFWFNLRRGRFTDFITQFSMSDVGLESDNELQPPNIEKLSGLAQWVDEGRSKWRLSLRDFQMVTPDFVWQPHLLQLRASPVGPHRDPSGQKIVPPIRYQIFADNLKILPWTDYFLATQPQDSKLFQFVNKTRPRGAINNLFIDLTYDANTLMDYKFAFDLQQFRNSSWQLIPGFRDLDLRAWGTKESLLFEFEEDSVELNYPRIFRDQLELNKLQGALKLTLGEDSFQLQSNAIQAHVADAQSVTQLALTIPKDSSQIPFIRLQSTLRNGNGKRASKYLPAGVLAPPLLEWLDGAIIDGQLLRGDIVVHGPLKRGMEEPQAVVLGFTVENSTLQFLPDWKQPVKNLLADVVVDGSEVTAHALAGSYYKQSLQRGLVHLPRFQPQAPPPLYVKVHTKGRAKSGIKVLKNTPLAERIGGFAQDLDAVGELDLEVNLAVPLKKERMDEMQAKVAAGVDQGWLSMRNPGIEIHNLKGDIHYDLNEGLWAKGLTGESFGGEIKAQIRTNKPDWGQEIEIQVQGRGELEQLKAWQPISILKFMEGSMDYNFDLFLPLKIVDESQPRSYFELTTNMKGVKVDLPAPFGKSADNSRPVNLRYTVDSKPNRLELRYGSQLHLVSQNENGHMQRGMLQLGTGSARLPSANVLEIQGTLGQFDSVMWMPVLDQLKDGEQENGGKEGNSLVQMLGNSDLSVGNLKLGGVKFGTTSIRLRRGQGGWQLGVDSPVLRGNAEVPFYAAADPKYWPAQKQPVSVDITRLTLAASETSANEGAWTAMDLSPVRFPPLKLNIRQFKYGDADFGYWDVKATPRNGTMNIDWLRATMNGVNIDGAGRWSTGVNGAPYTHLIGTATTPDAGNVMEVWGAEPSLSSKSALAKLDVSWPGSPIEFALKRVGGSVDTHLSDGRFLNVNANAAGKLWGALNFETMLRRLQLNFDDLRESELVYDTLDGHFRLQDGKLQITKFEMDAPAIKMRATGSLDLNKELLDMGLNVTVPVTRNLVLPAAVIGGVPAAATAFVVEKVFGDQFDKLTTIKYGISGSFDKPVVEVKDSFNIIPKQVSEAVMKGESSKPDTNERSEPQPKPLLQPKVLP